MHSPSALLLAIAALAMAAPLPLNINLGAYSPALVVGDGAIEIEGAANAAPQLINSLQGGAVGGAGAAAGGAEAAAVQPAAGERAQILSEPATLPMPGQTKELDPRVGTEAEAKEEAKVPWVKRQLAGFDRALRYAEAALVKGPRIQMGGGDAGIGMIVDNNQVAAVAPIGH